jgi:hypothetical protein
MKFIDARPFSDPEAAARKLMEIANAAEAVQDGRIHIEKINGPFQHTEGVSPAKYGAGMKLAIEAPPARSRTGQQWKSGALTLASFKDGVLRSKSCPHDESPLPHRSVR